MVKTKLKKRKQVSRPKRVTKTPEPKPLPKLSLRDMMMARRSLQPSLTPQPSPYMPQYIQQKDKNDNMQNQIDNTKRAFEEEQA